MTANLLGGDGLIVIVIALVVLVGGSQLPKIARNVGLAGKEFRNAQAEAEEDAAAKKAAQAAALPAVAPAPAPAPAPAATAPLATAPSTPSPVAGPVASTAPVAAPVDAAPAAEPGITLTPGQLDALLKAREEQVRNESTNN